MNTVFSWAVIAMVPGSSLYYVTINRFLQGDGCTHPNYAYADQGQKNKTWQSCKSGEVMFAYYKIPCARVIKGREVCLILQYCLGAYRVLDAFE